MINEARNPFFHRQGVADSTGFFGRSDLVRSVLEMIGSGQSCAVVGERRIGKTSLLAFLADPAVQRRHGLEAERVLTASVDFQALPGCTANELCEELLEALLIGATDDRARPLIERALSQPEPDFPALRRCCRGLRRQGFRIVVLADEFELAVQNPALDEAFFGALRSLAGGEGVVFVTASRLGLLELEQYRGDEARRKVLASPFFNIFAEFAIGPFADHEVAELLACSLQSTPVRFTAQDVELLDAIAGRHPYFVQLAAYHLYRCTMHRRRRSPSGSSSDIHSEVIEAVRSEAQKIFRNLWMHSQELERRALINLVGIDSGLPAVHICRDAKVVGRLETRGLVRSSPRLGQKQTAGEDGRYRLFSVLLAEWLRDSVSFDTAESVIEHEAPRAATATPIAAEDPSRYTILEEIGKGGSGTVHKAWDERLDRVVAIKVLSSELRSTPTVMQRMLQEARTCASLNHPNIVVIHDIDIGRGLLVQEFLAGGSLADLLDGPDGHLEDRFVIALARQLAGALAAAHGAGVVHRDIKPANILLASRPRPGAKLFPGVKVVDFGTAARTETDAASDERRRLAGTLAYMAPEQLRGERAGPSADIYSLGIVLFEAWHGRRPAIDETGAVKFARRLAAALETPLGLIINRCLAPSPLERYRDGAELMAALGHLSGR